MVYVICFLLSTFFLWLGTKHCTNAKVESGEWINVKPKKITTAIGILIPCVLASLRSTSVGSDVELYALPFFRRALSAENFTSYVLSIGGKNTDFLYNSLNYVIAGYTDNIGWLFFFIELIIIICVFWGSWELREGLNPWKSMFFFYFVFYNITLSTLRQSCACAVVFCGMACAINGKFEKKALIKLVIAIMVASFFHATAVAAFAILIIWLIILKGKAKPFHIGIGAVVGCLFIRLFAASFFSMLSQVIALVSSKYTNEYFLNSSGVGFNGYLTVILLGIIVIIILWMLNKTEKKRYWKQINQALLAINLIYVFAMLLVSNVAFVPRLMYYIQIMWCLPLAQSDKLVKKDTNNRRIMFFLTTFVVFAYWLYFFVISGVHGTYPYKLR